MDALERLRDHGADAEQPRTLRRPVARGSRAVFLAGEHHERHAVPLVAHGGVVDRHLLARRIMDGDAALDALHHLVLDADVGEGAAHHHLVIAAPRPVGVEVGARNAVFGEVAPGRAVGLDGPGRRDVVGGDRIEEQPEDAGVDHVLHRLRRQRHSVEVRRVLDIGGGLVPGVGHAAGDLDPAPRGVAPEHVLVAGGERLAGDVGAHRLRHVLAGRPDVLQEHRLALAVVAQRLGGEIDVDRPGERIGHHQRRRGEVVGAHVRVHPALEVAVAGEHRHRDEVVPAHRFGDRIRQRPGVADAGGAAVTDEIEAELVELLLEAGRLQVFGDDLASGRKRRLDPRLRLQAEPVGVARQKARRHHHRRVGGVGAGSDRGDHHVAVAEIEVGAFDRIAAGGEIVLAELVGHHPGEARRGGRQRHPVLRALRAGERGLDRRKVEVERIGEHRLGRELRAEHALRLRIGLDQRHLRGGPPGGLEVGERFGRDGEEPAGRAVFGGHVGDGRHVLKRQAGKAGTEELDKLPHHALPAQHLGDGEHEVGGGGALRQRAGEADADDLRDQHGDRLPQHRRLGLDAADAPAQHGEAVHHGGVAVGADEGVGEGEFDGLALHLLLLRPDGAGEIFEVDLMADAGARRHHTEIVERALAPLQERVALAVAVVFELHVLAEGIRLAEVVHHHRMVDHQIDRRQRVDLPRVALQRLHGVAHGGEIDHGGNAGEVLHQHARRAEGDFALGLAAGGEEGGDALDVGPGHRPAVLVAQQVFQQHLERNRKPGNACKAVLLRRLEAEVGVILRSHLERLAALETVERWHRVLRIPLSGDHAGWQNGAAAAHPPPVGLI